MYYYSCSIKQSKLRPSTCTDYQMYLLEASFSKSFFLVSLPRLGVSKFINDCWICLIGFYEIIYDPDTSKFSVSFGCCNSLFDKFFIESSSWFIGVRATFFLLLVLFFLYVSRCVLKLEFSCPNDVWYSVKILRSNSGPFIIYRSYELAIIWFDGDSVLANRLAFFWLGTLYISYSFCILIVESLNLLLLIYLNGGMLMSCSFLLRVLEFCFKRCDSLESYEVC